MWPVRSAIGPSRNGSIFSDKPNAPAFYVAAVIAVLVGLGGARADSISNFYRGKTVRMVIGTGEGGGYDISGRTVARYLPRYIPGNPTVVAQNMPGAAGLRAAEYMYRVAPQDGSVIGMTLPVILLNAVIDPNVRFSPDQFGWIGRVSSVLTYGVVWHGSPVQTLEAAKKESIFMGTAPGVGPGVTIMTVLNQLVGTKFKVVQGYKSGVEECLALERGEIQGISSVGWEVLNNRGWIESNMVTFLYQNSLGRTAKVPNVPTILDIAEDDSTRAIMRLVATPGDLGRALMAPPNIPPDRLMALRKAFDDLTRDQDFLRDMSNEAELDFLPGSEVQKIVAAAMAVPQSVLERARQVLPKP
jgi:tripartite-type tricarboxylate transporter receptor subunit TctC